MNRRWMDETAEHRRREEAVARAVADYWGFEDRGRGEDGARIDRQFYRRDRLSLFVEIKTRDFTQMATPDGEAFVRRDKLEAAYRTTKKTGLAVRLVYSWVDGTGWIDMGRLIKMAMDKELEEVQINAGKGNKAGNTFWNFKVPTAYFFSDTSFKLKNTGWPALMDSGA